MQPYLSGKEFTTELEYADRLLFSNGKNHKAAERLELMKWLYTNLDEPEKPNTKEELPRYLWELGDKIERDRTEYLNPEWMKYVDGIAAFTAAIGATRVTGYLPMEYVWVDAVLAAVTTSPLWVRRIRKFQYKKKFPKLEEAFKKGLASYCHALKDVYENVLTYNSPDGDNLCAEPC